MNKETSSIDKSRNKPNYHAIDLTKFICSVLVVMVHYKPFGEAESGSMLWYLNFFIKQYCCRLAVPFFFITSGFFLYKKINLKDFHIAPAKNYALRILKLYVLWTIIYFPITFLNFFKEEKGMFHAVAVYIRDIIFVGSHYHLWYLNATVFAVMLISILLSKKISPKKIIFLAGCFYIIGLFGTSWFGLLRPIQEICPAGWDILKLVQKIIHTTRNGLFFGFIFIALGMGITFFKPDMKQKTALIGFSVSMILTALEVILLEHFHIVKTHDMYLFLLPATFFLFCWIRKLYLPDSPIYKRLRILSSLIYYIHVWVGTVIKAILNKLNESLAVSSLLFIATLAITILLSYCIMKCSEKPKLNWLKKLYT